MCASIARCGFLLLTSLIPIIITAQSHAAGKRSSPSLSETRNKGSERPSAYFKVAQCCRAAPRFNFNLVRLQSQCSSHPTPTSHGGVCPRWQGQPQAGSWLLHVTAGRAVGQPGEMAGVPHPSTRTLRSEPGAKSELERAPLAQESSPMALNLFQHGLRPLPCTPGLWGCWLCQKCYHPISLSPVSQPDAKGSWEIRSPQLQKNP